MQRFGADVPLLTVISFKKIFNPQKNFAFFEN